MAKEVSSRPNLMRTWNVSTERAFLRPTRSHIFNVSKSKSSVYSSSLAFYSRTSRTVFKLGVLLNLEALSEAEHLRSLLAKLALNELSFSISSPRLENSLSQPDVIDGRRLRAKSRESSNG